MAADDPETQRALDAALARVRRFCGWHVSPVMEQTFSVRGGGWNYIVIPTLKVASITSITENGQTVDLDDVEQYSGEPGVIYKKNCGRWCGRVEITVDHGFTAAEAEDFRGEVLALIDRNEVNRGTGGSGPVTEYEVDDIHLRWSASQERLMGIAKDPLNESVLYQFKLLAFA